MAADYIWIEGESATKTNLTANIWLKGDNPKLLSAGDAFACLNTKADLPSPGFVLWKFNAPKAGTYHVYFRHAYKGHLGKMRYRFVKLGPDGSPIAKPGPEEGWIDFDLDAKVMDQIPIGQWRTVEWTRQAPANLEEGSYLMDLQVLDVHPSKIEEGGKAPIWTMIDVICLTPEPFTPAGATKPGETPTTGGGTTGGADYY